MMDNTCPILINEEKLRRECDRLKIELDTQKILTDGANERVQIFNKNREGLLRQRDTLKAEVERLREGERARDAQIDKLTNDIIDVTCDTPPLPTVWVRLQGSQHYHKCDEDGNFTKGDCAHFHDGYLMNVRDLLKGLATVRVWEKSLEPIKFDHLPASIQCPHCEEHVELPMGEPEREWVMRVDWGTFKSLEKSAYLSTIDGVPTYGVGTDKVEDAIKVLLKGQCGGSWRQMVDYTKTPTFGVRKLDEGEVEACGWAGFFKFYTGAFRDGNMIAGSESRGDDLEVCAKGSINHVLSMLSPAVPAVRLQDLEVIDHG